MLDNDNDNDNDNDMISDLLVEELWPTVGRLFTYKIREGISNDTMEVMRKNLHEGVVTDVTGNINDLVSTEVNNVINDLGIQQLNAILTEIINTQIVEDMKKMVGEQIQAQIVQAEFSRMRPGLNPSMVRTDGVIRGNSRRVAQVYIICTEGN